MKATPAQEKIFWDLLGGKGKIASAESGGDDELEDAKPYADELLKFTEVTKGQIKSISIPCEKMEKGILQSENVYVMDCTNEIYIWMGKKSSTEQACLFL